MSWKKKKESRTGKRGGEGEDSRNCNMSMTAWTKTIAHLTLWLFTFISIFPFSEDRNLLHHTQCCTSLTSTNHRKAFSAMICWVQGQLVSSHPAVRSFHSLSSGTTAVCWLRTLAETDQLVILYFGFPVGYLQRLWMLLGLRHFWRNFSKTIAFYVCVVFFICFFLCLSFVISPLNVFIHFTKRHLLLQVLCTTSSNTSS